MLAFPSLGLIPTGTPLKNEPNNPPPGVGPYMITNIVPNASFSLVKNPEWAKMNIPGIPAGHVNVNVKISSNVDANALSVLNNTADIFDWADTIPGSLLPQIKSQAADRFSQVRPWRVDVLHLPERRRRSRSQASSRVRRSSPA